MNEFVNSSALPSDVRAAVPPAGHEIFRKAANASILAGHSELLVMVKGYRALEEAGFKASPDGRWTHPSVHKDGPTVGDVHVNRPLGSDKKKPRKLKEKDDPGTDEPDVDELEEDLEAEGEQPGEGETAPPDDDDTAPIPCNKIARVEKRISGSSNIALNADGEELAQELGRRIAEKGGLDVLITSPLKRAIQTGDAIEEHAVEDSIFRAKPAPELQPWHLGDIEGKEAGDVADLIKHYIEHPDEVPPGKGADGKPGESFNDSITRQLKYLLGLYRDCEAMPTMKEGVVMHGRGLDLLKAYIDAGMPEDLKDLDLSDLLNPDDDQHASMMRWHKGEMQDIDLEDDDQLKAGLYPILHSLTDDDTDEGNKDLEKTEIASAAQITTEAANAIATMNAAASIDTVMKFLPPLEVARAAKTAWDSGMSVEGITSYLAEGEGLAENDIRKIAAHFADSAASTESAAVRDSWGGLFAAKWAARVLRKIWKVDEDLTEFLARTDLPAPDADDLRENLAKYSPDQPRSADGKFGSGGGGAKEKPKVKDPFGVFGANSCKAAVAHTLSDGQFHHVDELKAHAKTFGVKEGQISAALTQLKNAGVKLEFQGKNVKASGKGAASPTEGAKPVVTGTPATVIDPSPKPAATFGSGKTHAEFTDYNSAHEFGMALNGGWGKTLSSAEKEALSNYRGNGYVTINYQLRSNATIHEGTLEQVSHIDAALARTSLPQEIHTYRGFGSKTELLNQVGPGKALVDNGFVSSSLMKNTAGSFGAYGKVIAKIEIPKGARAAYISHNKSEQEVLLARGTTFKFVGKEGNVVTLRALQPQYGITKAEQPEDSIWPDEGPEDKPLTEEQLQQKYSWEDGDVLVIDHVDKGDWEAWHAVDLDGTLAGPVPEALQGTTAIGPPLPSVDGRASMVDRVKQWLVDGAKVRIFTARVADDPDGKIAAAIAAWCKEYIGEELPVTNEKDPGMIDLWDDRSVNPTGAIGDIAAVLGIGKAEPVPCPECGSRVHEGWIAPALTKTRCAACGAVYSPGNGPGVAKGWVTINGNRVLIGDDGEIEAGHPLGGGGGLQAAPDRAKWPDHIKALNLPPAWTNVQISRDKKADLLAIGKDAKGRSQYVYSERFKTAQAEAKFQRVQELDKKFDTVRNQNAALMKSKDPVQREHAQVAHLIMSMGLRPGSNADTQASVKAYGATTLEGRHVRVSSNDNVSLNFIGKKGVQINLPVTDRGLASMLKARKEEAGGKGKLFPNVTGGSLLNHVHTLDGGGFKTKDFRTLLGTREAIGKVKAGKPPKNEKEYKRAVLDVAKHVSSKLGNTPTVALQSYIHPAVFSSWRAGLGKGAH